MSESQDKKIEELISEIQELKSQLNESEETLRAIRNGEVDAIIISGDHGEKVFSLASSETPYRVIIEEMNEGAVTVSSKGTILYSNRSFADIISAPLEQIIGSEFSKFINPGDRPIFKRLLKNSRRRKIRGDVSILINDKTIHLQLSFVALPPEMEGDVCIVVSDITEINDYQNYLQEIVEERTSKLFEANRQMSKDLENLRRAEKALSMSEERYSLAINAAYLGTWDHVFCDNTVKMSWSDHSYYLFGIPIGTTLTLQIWNDAIHTDDRKVVNEKFYEAIENKTLYDHQYRVIWPDKSLHWIHSTGKSSYNVVTSKVSRMIGISRDITGSKIAEISLKESEKHYRLLSETMLQGVVYHNSNGIIISVNPAAGLILGKEAGELPG